MAWKKPVDNALLVICVVVCVVVIILISGCTALNSNQHETTPVSSTDGTPAATTQSVQSEDTTPEVSGSDGYPEYTEQTKSRLIEEAKDEIVRVYPDVERATLEGYWVDHNSGFWVGKGSAAFGPPCIRFDNVDDTSEKYIEILKTRWKGLEGNIHNNIVIIRVDPESGDIVFYGAQSIDWPLEDEIRVVSFEETEDRALEFVRKVKGNDFVEGKKDDFYIYRLNSDANMKSGLAYTTLYNTYNGVQYLNDRIYLQHDLIQDKVVRYEDMLKDPELMESLTTLSPVPTISENKAKEILESELKERYPDEDLNIQYRVLNGHENSLNWYDQEELVYSRQPEPIRLIWYIAFNDEEMREQDSRKTTTAIIDAHTGEIVSLYYRDIKI